MQAFLSSLTAGLLFIHTVFGCCWHHAHACENVASAAACETHCCHHHHQGGEKESEDKPCHCDEGCEGTCTYVAPQKVKVEAPDIAALDLTVTPELLAGLRIEPANFWQAARLPLDLSPPLRVHLLHQVLLN